MPLFDDLAALEVCEHIGGEGVPAGEALVEHAVSGFGVVVFVEGGALGIVLRQELDGALCELLTFIGVTVAEESLVDEIVG